MTYEPSIEEVKVAQAKILELLSSDQTVMWSDVCRAALIAAASVREERQQIESAPTVAAVDEENNEAKGAGDA